MSKLLVNFKIIVDKLHIKNKSAKALVNKIKMKHHCTYCNGKGYNICNMCTNGCFSCKHSKFELCPFCSGGFNSQILF